mmetsp:Transcript_5793/g.11590  ORF Transcript_5793/g.11590 Transcript_5793/m.11590 type:complete len:107 (+) Transcript_5793:268-588(+)
MSNKLKEKVEADLGTDKVLVELNPVDSSDGKPKVYSIEIQGDMLFEWVMKDGNAEVKKAPAESWKTPLNFETHADYFGPGLGTEGGEGKQAMYDLLKETLEKVCAK